MVHSSTATSTWSEVRGMAKTNGEGATRIAAGAQVRGKIAGSEDLSVAGRLEGSLQLEGVLTVEPEGVVKADVFATRVVIAGILVGNIEAAVEKGQRLIKEAAGN